MTKPNGMEIVKDNPPLWDQFTRKEEYESDNLDRHRRYRFVASRCPDLTEPEVSRYLLRRGIQVDFPENKDFAIVLTHDIDQICPPMARSLLSAMSSIKRMDLAECNDQLFWRFGGMERSPFRNFQKIMELESRYDARSTFFFMTEGPDFRGGGYPVEQIASDIAQISDEGWEVGLHGTYNAYLSLQKILEERRSLEKIVGKRVIGYRNHFLRFKVPQTWRAVSEAGFFYDSTLGYAEHVGFRNGMIHPFQPFDRGTGATIPLLEFPLAIMDDTLYNDNKMGLSPAEGWATMERLLRTAKECHGTLVILWHNTTFGNPALKDWAKMYEKLLRKGKDEGAWLCSGEELANWWMNHGFRPSS